MSQFVHLHVHTDFSALDGACQANRLIEHAKRLGMGAIGISDHGTISGVPSFVRAAKAGGLKPIVGCEMYLAGRSRLEKLSDSNPTYHMGLIARNAEGYRNLVLLSSDANLRGFHYKPRTDLSMLAKHRAGLIGFTGCLQGMVPQLLLAGQERRAREAVAQLVDILGRDSFFVEIMDHGLPDQRRLIDPLRNLAREFGLRMVASNDVHYIERGHADAHDALLCIQTGARVGDAQRIRYDPREYWLKSEAEMLARFAHSPEALTATAQVADMCELDLDFKGRHFPKFAPPAGFSDTRGYLRHLCAAGMAQRYGIDLYRATRTPTPTGAETVSPTREVHRDAASIVARLEHELGVIDRTGFTDYFLVVADFVDWARRQGIPVGPGRGSAAGCMVAYVLGITAICPHENGLLFERFLNEARVSPPDIDVDFCQRRRGEVIDYVRRKYGDECVSGITTFNTLGAKLVVRDLGRVHGLPMSEVDKLSSLVSDELVGNIEGNAALSPDLRGMIAASPTVRTIFEQGDVLIGAVRNAGKHPSGIIIADEPLGGIVPMLRSGDDIVAGFDYNVVGDLGLLKMDFLGLKTLTVIEDATAFIRKKPGESAFDVHSVPLDDEKTLRLFREGRTVGVFQFESPGMQSLCRQIGVARIEELSAANALFRPGPMDWIPDYIASKRDPAAVTHLHPLLEDIGRETYGVLVYQEQVMNAARVIAGFTLGQADNLRRAMGKKLAEEMSRQRAVFVAGAAETNGITADVANKIFDVLEKFAGYGFNKSHAVGYARLAYFTAYLKAHHPAEFMAALLSSEIGDIEKTAKYCQEARALGLEILPPDVNHSDVVFTPEGKAVRYGLSGIKSVGDAAALAIVSARDAEGPFTSLADLAMRVPKKQASRRTIESLVKVGALGSIEEKPGRLLAQLDVAIAAADESRATERSGQGLLFDLPVPAPAVETGPEEVDFSKAEELAAEREFFGFYLSGHPLDEALPLVSALASHLPSELQTAPDKTPFRLCGMISELVVRTTKVGAKQWAQFTLDTPHGGYPIQCYSDAYERAFDTLHQSTAVVLSGRVLRKDDGVRLTMADMVPLDEAAPAFSTRVSFALSGQSGAELVSSLRDSYAGPEKETSAEVTNRDTGEVLLFGIRLSLHALKTIMSHPAVDAGSVVVVVKPFAPSRPKWEGVMQHRWRSKELV